MAESLPVSATIGLVKSIACVYDVVTLPVYSLIQRPWSKTRASSEAKAIQEKSDDPYSPWVRIGSPPPHLCYSATSIADLFSSSCKKYQKNNCFGYRQILGEEDEKQSDGKVFKKQILGDYIWYTYEQVDRQVDNIAKGLLLNGVSPGDVVLILAETRLDWMLAAQAVFRLGATIATLYSTLGDDAIIYGINETSVTHVITSHDLIPKICNFQSKLPTVRTVIYFEGLKTPDTSNITGISFIPFKVLAEQGRSTTKSLKFSPPKSDDPAVIMYTSGSTGIPKGVILTHGNVLTTIGGFFAVANSLSNQATYMAYLPLAHVLELAAETFFFSIGVSIGFSTPHTMTDKSTAIKKGQHGDAVLLQPTVMAAVPLVLDRIRKGIVDQMTSRGPFFTSLFNFVVDYKKYWIRKGYDTPIVNALVSRKIRAMLGGRISHIVTGSAPLSPDTMEFIRCCLDVTVIQGYGLTETAAGSCLMDLSDMSVGRVGPPLFGCKIKLVDWAEGNYFATDKPYPRGEIVVGGGCVASGYHKNDDLTTESFKFEDGVRWFYTGDIGEIHPDGSIKIIDRKKDLVKLQFGEYISLGKVETELKSCSIVDNICIYGDSYHNYIVAIVVPRAASLAALAKSIGKDHLTHDQLCRDPLVLKEVLRVMSQHCSKARLHKNEIPAKVLLVSDEWSPDTGLVTAAMKIRRKNVTERYKLDISRLYGKFDSAMST